MSRRHTVQPGEGISRIAELYGFAPETIWTCPENRELSERRSDPNVLVPGDVVFIPDKMPRTVSVKTGKVHRFRRVEVPPRLVLRLVESGRPRAGLGFRLVLDDGRTLQGSTDGDGILRTYVPSAARSARLYLADEPVSIEVTFGELQPVSEIRGVQQRLRNLGFDIGDEEAFGPGTRSALRAFQLRAGLQETGELDDATRESLARYHDSPATLPSDPESA